MRYFDTLALDRLSRIRGTVAALASGALVGGMLLPPVHVHLAVDHAGHEHSAALVHQHWGGHGSPSTEITETTEIEHGEDHDGRVFFLDQRAIASSGVSAHRHAALSVPIVFLNAVLDRDCPIRRIDVTATPHGPPRAPCSLRAPPYLFI